MPRKPPPPSEPTEDDAGEVPAEDDATAEVPVDAPRRGRGKMGVPISAMAEHDRVLVTRTTRRAYQILELMVERIWDQVVETDKKTVPKLHRDTTLAMVNLQRMAAGMIDKHPGLLEDLQEGGVDPMATDEEVEGMLEALDV
jgi:hypothetical protein